MEKNKKQFGVWMDSRHASVVGREGVDSGDFALLGHFKNAGPDSNSNEPGSHGLISYTINALTTLTVQDRILNTAYIYFDHNAPIATNTSITTIGVGVDELSSDQPTISVYPNPITSKTKISYELNQSTTVKVNLINYQGKVIQCLFEGQQVQGIHELIFDSAHLPSGIYFISVIDNAGVRTKRVISMK